MTKAGESPKASLETTLLKKVEHFSFNEEMRFIAERLRDEAIAEIESGIGNCLAKQDVVRSLKVVKGQRQGEYLVVSEGDYGRNLEFGTKNSLESPWFIPAFVKVSGSIHNCLHGALKRALLKARRHHVSR